MSYIIIHQAMQNNQRYSGGGPQGPLSRSERICLAVVLIVLVAGITVGGVFAWKDYQAYTARVAQLHQAWDAGQGRPDATKVITGQTIAVKATVGSVNGDWDECTYKLCYRSDISHYPLVYPIGMLSLEDGCYTNTSNVSVDAIMVGATRAGVYSVTFQPDGKTVKVCAVGARQDDDKLVIWSDSPNAQR